MKTCKDCLRELPLESFYIRNKKTNLRRTICKDCMYKQSKQYKQLNEEKISQQLKNYRDKNSDKLKEYLKKYNIDNKERIAEVKKKYYHNNIENITEYNADYYQKNKKTIIKKVLMYSRTEKGKLVKKNTSSKRRLKFQQGNIDTDTLLEMKSRNKNCYWCNSKIIDSNYHIDHYVPLSKGGSHTIDNIVISCPACNIKKSNKDPYEFALSVGKLL